MGAIAPVVPALTTVLNQISLLMISFASRVQIMAIQRITVQFRQRKNSLPRNSLIAHSNLTKMARKGVIMKIQPDSIDLFLIQIIQTYIESVWSKYLTKRDYKVDMRKLVSRIVYKTGIF